MSMFRLSGKPHDEEAAGNPLKSVHKANDLDSLSIRVTRLDAAVSIAARKNEEVENMVLNAEQWFERKLQEATEQMRAEMAAAVDERVEHVLRRLRGADQIVHCDAGESVSSGTTHLQRDQEFAEESQTVEAAPFVATSSTQEAVRLAPRKRPSIKRAVQSTTMSNISLAATQDVEANAESEVGVSSCSGSEVAVPKPGLRKRAQSKRSRQPATQDHARAPEDSISDAALQSSNATLDSDPQVHEQMCTQVARPGIRRPVRRKQSGARPSVSADSSEWVQECVGQEEHV